MTSGTMGSKSTGYKRDLRYSSPAGHTSLIRMVPANRYRVFTVAARAGWLEDKFFADYHEAAKEFTRQIMLHH